jgi:hypothetical protein
MVLLVMIFPLACLASIGTRYTFMFYAVRNAAREASRCTQYLTDQSPYQRSAVNRANQMMALWANPTTGFRGVSAVSTTTWIHVINIASGAITRYSTPIPAAVPIDTNANVYNITVQVNANIDPLFEGGNGWFNPNIPGLTTRFPVTITCASMCEKPSGLKN